MIRMGGCVIEFVNLLISELSDLQTPRINKVGQKNFIDLLFATQDGCYLSELNGLSFKFLLPVNMATSK